MNDIPYAIGIDFGAAKSVMAMMRGGEPRVILNGQGDPLTPSAVSLGKRGELLIGKAAKNRTFDKNTILSIRRFMGLPFELVEEDSRRVSYDVSQGPGGEVRVHFNNRIYSPTEISAMILHRLRQDAQDRLGERVGRAVVTVPAYFNDAQVAATREAGRMAGFTVMRIIREPVAAALAFGLHKNANTASALVYDLGATGFDATILMMEQGAWSILGMEGDQHLGGDDFDYEIMKHLYRRATSGQDLPMDPAVRRSLKLKVEEAKIALSNATAVEINIPMVGGVDIEDELTSEDLNRLIAPWISRTVELTRKVMHETNMTPQQIDHVLLAGGSTLIPLVRGALRREFGAKIRSYIDPTQCVALGAAIQTSVVDQFECPNPACRDETGQPTQNPIGATECRRCKTSLIGLDVVTCPDCFVPREASQPTCRKCSPSVHEDVAVEVVPVSPREEVAVEVVPISPSEEVVVEAVSASPRDEVAVEVAPVSPREDVAVEVVPVSPREEVAVEVMPVSSREEVPVEVVPVNPPPAYGIFEVIPENLGIELADGRMDVLFPKNAAYPTSKLVSRDLYTLQADQKRFEFVMRQGPSDVAAENEYCGALCIELPPILPKGTAVTVSLGLDKEGLIVATAQLRDLPNLHATVCILRGESGDPIVRRRRDELVQRAKEAMKNKDLPEGIAQAILFAERVFELDRSSEISSEDLDRFEKQVESFQASVAEYARSRSAVSEAEQLMAELERQVKNIRQILAQER